MRYITYFFWLVIIIIGVTFASLNPHMVKVNYYVNVTMVHLPLLLLVTLIVGAVLGIVVLLPSLIRNKHRNRYLRNRIKAVEQEVKNLRNIPIKDNH